MDVPRADDDVRDLLVPEVGEHLPLLGLVPVPLVGVHREAVLRHAGELLERPGHLVRPRPVGELGEHRLVADDPPPRRRRAESLLEPRLLFGPQVGAVRIADLGVRLRPRDGQGAGELLVAVLAGVEHDQVREIAEGEISVDPHAGLITVAGQPDRHPLLVGPVGVVAPHDVVALVGLVVLGPLPPVVVRDLVVVPGRDERVGRVRRAQGGIRAVVAVAIPVVREREDLVGRVVVPYAAATTLVDVVAHMHHEVEVVAFGDVAPGGIVAGGEVLAARHGEGQLLPAVRGGGPHPARTTRGPQGLEPVPVGGPGVQTVHVHLHGVVGVGAGLGDPRTHDVGEVRRRGHLPDDAHGAGGADVRPDDDPVGKRVAGSDTVPEGLGIHARGPHPAGAEVGRHPQPGRARGRPPEEPASGQVLHVRSPPSSPLRGSPHRRGLPPHRHRQEVAGAPANR